MRVGRIQDVSLEHLLPPSPGQVTLPVTGVPGPIVCDCILYAEVECSHIGAPLGIAIAFSS